MRSPYKTPVVIGRLAARREGMSVAELAQEAGVDRRVAGYMVSHFKQMFPSKLIAVRLDGSATKRYFTSRLAADAFLQRDPVLRVVPNQTGAVRISFRRKAFDLTPQLARRLLHELAEALQA